MDQKYHCLVHRSLFKGPFSIGDTSLNVALRQRNYVRAETIIEGTLDPSSFNDVSYKNVPIFNVLPNYYNSGFKRNLKFAKHLVLKGANPNLQIHFDDSHKWSPSPFEELVVGYEALRYFVNGMFCTLAKDLYMKVKESEVLEKIVGNTIDLNGKLCLANMDDCKKLVKQMRNLIDIFLENGASPDVFSYFYKTTLFHWVVEWDFDLGLRFLATGCADVNAPDSHNNTPLMKVIYRNEPCNSLQFYELIHDANPLNVNNVNCLGKTALFWACFVGDVETAVKLCDAGARLDQRVAINVIYEIIDCNECRQSLYDIKHRGYIDLLPVLFAPFAIPSDVRDRYAYVCSYKMYEDIQHHKHLTDKIISSAVSPVVDWFMNSQLKQRDAVTVELSELTCLLEYTNFKHLSDGRIQPSNLVSLMLGQVSAGLQQLCIRAIFDHVLMVSKIPQLLWPDKTFTDFCIKGCDRALKRSDLSKLVKILKLPKAFKICFEIEVAKYQMCTVIINFHQHLCCNSCQPYGSDFEMFDLSDSSELFDLSHSSESLDLSDSSESD